MCPRAGWWIVLALVGCQREVPSVPAEIDVWARQILALPVDDVCAGEIRADFFCSVRPALFTPAVRELGARSITLQNIRGERYVDIDWGAGHVEAHGMLVGPSGWTRRADEEFQERAIRDGVFSYDKRRMNR
jgi:hypothetical protein